MQQKKWISILLTIFSLLFISPAHSDDYRVTKVIGDKEKLVLDILSLALSKSDPQSNVIQYKEALPQSRLIEEVNLDNIDIMWAGADPSLDKTMLPIRIPILKGLLGHRIFIIKKENQSRFNNIKTLADLKKLTAGQGTKWGDTKILKSINIPVITTLKYPNLFYMLEGERFDYFPRAIHEPWSEVAKRPELNLAVEKNIMLVYPFAMYFFVKKDNQILHDKLYKGFEMAIKDGSFDTLFLNNQGIKDALIKTNIKNRTVIKVPNPAMHPDTPTDREEFWLDTSNL